MTFSPDDEFRVDFTIEPEIMPGCLLIYEPDQSKVSSKFHFMACSEVMSVVSGGYSLLYRLTNRITGEFEMCDGSMKVLPVCGKCCREWTQDNYTAENFSIRDFFRKYGESQIPEDVLFRIRMGAVSGIYRNDTGKYPKYWRDITSPIHRKITDHCEICGGKTNLAVHHINMYKPDTTSGNLIVLCRSCHTTIHNALRKILFTGTPLSSHETKIFCKYNALTAARRPV